MRARALNGNEIDIEQGAIDGLKTRLRGPVLVPEDHGYEEARTVWNAMIDKRPALIARCKTAEDVAAAVRFAREQEMLVSVRALS